MQEQIVDFSRTHSAMVVYIIFIGLHSALGAADEKKKSFVVPLIFVSGRVY